MKKEPMRIPLEALPPLTEADRARLRTLAARPDEEIDQSEIGELTDAEWAGRTLLRGHFYRPRKQSVTARLDSDVIAWLKSHGKGYQSRMNAILRREMLEAIQGEQALPSASRRVAG